MVTLQRHHSEQVSSGSALQLHHIRGVDNPADLLALSRTLEGELPPSHCARFLFDGDIAARLRLVDSSGLGFQETGSEETGIQVTDAELTGDRHDAV